MTKLEQVKQAYATGNYKDALRIAAKFPQLGNERKAITLANECFSNPRFYKQVGVNIDQAIADGVKTLGAKYGF
ncbi:MAG: hypothetical protein D0531_01160 [Methylococcales bacterium]|nr:MAG: hypothetical protein D0531_01160 [Methylococcales bacterium]